MLNGFLLGVIVSCSAAAGVFFLKFWYQTRDSFFLLFGIAFLVEGLDRVAVLFLDNPSEGNPIIYGVRLLAIMLIFFAILRKNYGPAGR